MTLSLRARLFLTQALVVTVALGAAILLAAREEHSWLLRRDTDILVRVARTVERELTEDSAWRVLGWPAAARSLGHRVGYRVTLFDATGRVLGDTDNPAARFDSLGALAKSADVMEALRGRTGHRLGPGAVRGESFLSVAVPIPHVPGIAVVRVAESLAEISERNTSLFTLWGISGLLSLAAILAATYWLTARHVARLEGLGRLARRIGQGELHTRAPEWPADEVGSVAAALNAMATQLHARLDALERARDEREQILAHMNDGVLLLDGKDIIVHANLGMATIFELPLTPETGARLDRAVPVPELLLMTRQARTLGHTVERELQLDLHGHERIVHAIVTPLDSAQAMVVVHDLTESERLNRVRRDFVANVSHELRTPLTSIRGYSETLLDGALGDEQHSRRFVQVIHDQTLRLQRLADDLLTLSDLERPELRLSLGHTDVRDIATRLVQGFQDRAARLGLHLTLEAADPQPIVADAQRVEQVLANLIDNALKYTEKGAVAVRVTGTPSVVLCDVADTGAGLSEPDRVRIFERFYRVDKARSRAIGGTGLGLSIVKHIAELHGGTADVHSTLGQGSTFRVTFPRDPHGSERHAASPTGGQEIQ